MDEDFDLYLDDVTVPVHGVLAPEGVPTRDGRKFAPDSLWWGSPPLSLLWQERTGERHDGSVVVGAIEEIIRKGGLIHWQGSMLGSEAAATVVEQIAEGALSGLSVDVLDATVEYQLADGTQITDKMLEEGLPEAPLSVFTKGELGGATIVPFPAYREAYIALGPLDASIREIEEPEEPEELEELVASAAADLFAISEKPWDGSASRFTPEEWFRSTIIHLSDDRENKSEHKLPIREPNGDLSRAGVHAAAGRLNQVDAPDSEIASARKALRSAYRQLGEDAPDAITASAGEFVDVAPGRTEDGDVGTLIPWRVAESPSPSTTSMIDPSTTSAGRGRGTSTAAGTVASLSVEARLVSRTGSQPTDSSTSGGSARSLTDQSSTTSATTTRTAREEADASTAGAATRATSNQSSAARISPEGRPPMGRDGSAATASTTSPNPTPGMSGLSMEFSDGRVESVTSLDAESGTVRLSDGTVLDAGRPLHVFGPTSNPSTMDGPGWLTHPIPTDRLRDYWTRGPGAAKIAWGTPGDFRRCRALLAPYVKAQFLSGYCANRHYDALGTWPGKHSTRTTDQVSEPYMIVASGRPAQPPRQWFEDPKLLGPSPLTVTEDGRVFGHVATWDTCHISYAAGKCVQAPHSSTDYAYFLTGAMLVEDGSQVRIGTLVIDTAHAGAELNAAAATKHYDDTGKAAAYVAAGEDSVGIWVAGCISPRATEDDVITLRASKLSGDWRRVGGKLEMVGALAVNVGGFPVPRSRETDEGVLSLVAAGVVPRGDFSDEQAPTIAEAVSAELDRREKDREARERMSALRVAQNRKRMDQIKERIS